MWLKNLQEYLTITDYLGLIATNIFPARNPEWQTIPPKWEENSKEFFGYSRVTS